MRRKKEEYLAENQKNTGFYFGTMYRDRGSYFLIRQKGGMIKLPRKQMPLFFILLFAFTLSACSSTGQIEKNRLTDSITPADQTVSVLRGTITPTVSAQTTIVPAVPFIISSPENGILNTGMKAEEKIAAGQVIGTVNGKEMKLDSRRK